MLSMSCCGLRLPYASLRLLTQRRLHRCCAQGHRLQRHAQARQAAGRPGGGAGSRRPGSLGRSVRKQDGLQGRGSVERRKQEGVCLELGRSRIRRHKQGGSRNSLARHGRCRYDRLHCTKPEGNQPTGGAGLLRVASSSYWLPSEG